MALIPKWGRKQRMGDLIVECGGSSVDRVMVSIKEDSNVHNNLHIKRGIQNNRVFKDHERT
jgi:hypothetical protein